MILLSKGNTEEIIVTLTEKATITSPNYLFVFQNQTTNEKIKIVFENADDISHSPERFNLFSIVVNDYFLSEDPGLYDYTVYEQSDLTETETGKTIVEEGKMKLTDTETERTEYEGVETIIKVYNA
jgi:hypothetical protein